MDLYCLASDIEEVSPGGPWKGFWTRYAHVNGVHHPDAKAVLGDWESNHDKLKPESHWRQSYKTAVKAATQYRVDTLALCPEGTPYVTYALPSTWAQNWCDGAKQEKELDVEQWCKIIPGIVGDGPTMLGALCYTYSANAKADRAWCRGRCEITQRVANKLGLPWCALVHHRLVDGASPERGRALAEDEIIAKLDTIREYQPNALFAWSCDHTIAASLTKTLTAPASIAKQAASRLALQAEMWGDVPPNWTPPMNPYLTYRARLARDRYYALIGKALSQ